VFHSSTQTTDERNTMTEIQTPETNAVPTNAVPETNAVPYFPHQAPPAVPLTKRAWFLPVALAVAVLVGAGATGAVAGSVAATKQANCKVAFQHADTALDAAKNTIGYLTDGLQAAARFDADTIQSLAPKIESEGKRITDITPEFKSSRAACEG
jgi:uncharacterized protein HemX